MPGETEGLFGQPDSVTGRLQPAAGFTPQRIILAKGSVRTRQRRALVEAICAAYPEAPVVDALRTPHNKIDLGQSDLVRLHEEGKQTLVLGEHNSAVRLSSEQDNTCPNYWHVSPYGFCPFDCAYCYLAGTRGVLFSPTVKIFVNLDAILAELGRVAAAFDAPTAFYLGKLQDGLALDPLTGYSRRLVPFFASHPTARLVILTKAADVHNLLGLDHNGHTILSWSLSPTEVWRQFESRTPSPTTRIEVMRRCAAAGYPIRAVLMPVIPLPAWRRHYDALLDELLTAVPLDRITLGGICSFPNALRLTAAKLGPSNAVTVALDRERSGDGRARYPAAQRVELYRHLITTIRRHRSNVPIGLCLEERRIFETLGMTAAIGRCNCVL